MKSILQKSCLIAAIYYCIILTPSCCHCDLIKTYNVEAKKITSNNLVYEFPNDSTYTSSIFTKDSIIKGGYGLTINIDFERIAMSETPIHWGNYAYACKCKGDSFLSKDSINNISIKTLYDFDATHSAGTDVSDYFQYFEMEYQPRKLNKYPITRVYQKNHTQFIYTPNYSLSFYLNNYPELNKKIQFEISINYKNGKNLKTLTQAITII